MTVDQVLTIGCGSVEEHAVLLVSWLLGLGYNAAIVLGRSLPEGTNAAYVLIEIENSPTYLINPCNANRYQLDDTTCPFFQICTVITSNNVYGNLQPVSHCSQMEFNFSVSAFRLRLSRLFSVVNTGNLFSQTRDIISSACTKDQRLMSTSQKTLL